MTEDESPTALPSGSLVPLEAILCTEELHRRPTRPPDYQAENRALGALVQALADSPPWGKTMVLIALTGWGQDEDRRQSQDAGFDAHLVKPVDYGALMELLATLPSEQGG